MAVYHRVQSPTQTPADARKQIGNGKICGGINRWSSWPSVDAYVGRLPAAVSGIEFETSTDPDAGSAPGYARWSGPRTGVSIVGERACIEAIVRKVVLL